MPGEFALIWAFCIPLTILANLAWAGPSSKGAQGMPGALGTFEFKPSDTLNMSALGGKADIPYRLPDVR